MIFNIEVKNKIASYTGTDKIVCGNSDYKIKFSFDEEWGDFQVKRARFSYVRKGREVYQDIIFEGDTCEVPALYDAFRVRVGVMAGDVRTTTPATIECKRSIACLDSIPDNHPKDAYAQLLKKYDELLTETSGLKTVIEANRQAFEAEQKKDKQSFANVIRNTASGSVVALTDISPLEHTLGVKARSENMLNMASAMTIGKEIIKTNEDSIILENFGGAGDYGCSWRDIPFVIGKTYTFSVENISAHSEVYGWVVKYSDGTANNVNGTFFYTTTISKPVEIVLFYVAYGSLPDKQDIIIEKLQCREGSVVLPYIPFVDVSNAKISRVGKNLFPYPYLYGSGTVQGVTYTNNGDGTITANRTATANSIYELHRYTIPLKAGTYNVSGLPSEGSDTSFMIQIATRSGFAKNVTSINGPSFTLDEDVSDLLAQLVVFKDFNANNLVFKPQIELGAAATDYEPYIEPITYSINADGTVEGVTSLYPTTTLYTDTEGVVLDVEYNVDSKKYIDNQIDKKFAELAAMIVNS